MIVTSRIHGRAIQYLTAVGCRVWWTECSAIYMPDRKRNIDMISGAICSMRPCQKGVLAVAGRDVIQKLTTRTIELTRCDKR